MFDAKWPLSQGGYRWRSWGAAVVALIALVTACTTPPGEDVQPDDVSVSVVPESGVLEVVSGGSASMTVTVDRRGPVSDVVLSVEGPLPTGVTVNFSPPVLADSMTTSTLTVSADASAAADHVELSLVATGDTADDSARLTLVVSRLLVMGRVVDDDGEPLAGVTVATQGHTDVSGSDGGFVLPDVSVPYDVTLAVPGERVIHRFDGLTSDEPELVPYALQLFRTPDSGAHVSGTVLDGDALPPGELVTVCAEGVDGTTYGCALAHEGDASYELDLSWAGSPARIVRLHAFHTSVVPDDVVVTFLGYASAEFQVADGASVFADLTLGPVSTMTLSSTVVPGAWTDAPSGPSAPEPAVLAAVRMGPGFAMRVSGDVGTGHVSLPVPVLPGVDLTYDMLATNEATARLLLDTGLAAGEVILPDRPTLVRPVVQSGPITTTTEFEVAGLAGFTKTFTWRPDQAGQPVFAVTTMADVVTMPDPKVVGLDVTPHDAYHWQVGSTFGTSIEQEIAGMRDARAALLTFLLVGGTPAASGGQYATSTDIEIAFPACCMVIGSSAAKDRLSSADSP